MLTELELAMELRKVRKLTARCSDLQDDFLFGAQQALVWALGEPMPPGLRRRSPSEVAEVLGQDPTSLKDFHK